MSPFISRFKSHNLFRDFLCCRAMSIRQDLTYARKKTPFQTRAPLSAGFSVTSVHECGVVSSENTRLLRIKTHSGFSLSMTNCAKGYASVAEAIASMDTNEDLSGSEEVRELLDQMIKEDLGQPFSKQQQPKKLGGMAPKKYASLRKRQIKMDTEAWDKAAEEYQELLADMCEQKLAPNLPYMKSLFLGWFEPLRNAIATEQEACKKVNNKNRQTHAPYFNGLPADMMAVITMHKLMGLLMTNSGGVGSTRVVQAALQIGEDLEHDVEKT